MTRHGQNHPKKGPSQRQLRVGEEIRHTLAWILERGELRDPVLTKTQVTITEVSVSPDLKNALCFITPLGGGDAEAVKTVVDALNRAKKFLRHEIAQRVNLKYTPALRFAHDTSFDEAGHIDELLHRPEVQRDLHADDAGGGDAGDAGDEGEEDA